MGTDQQQDITILMKFLCQDKTKTSHSIWCSIIPQNMTMTFQALQLLDRTIGDPCLM
jgi:hypothetical protein